MNMVKPLLMFLLLKTTFEVLKHRDANALNEDFLRRERELLQKTKDPRKLYENLTESFLLGESDLSQGDLNSMNMLIEEDNSRRNYKKIGHWLNDFESRLDEMRNAVNRRLTDMAIGLQRKNMVMYKEYKQEVEAAHLPAASTLPISQMSMGGVN